MNMYRTSDHFFATRFQKIQMIIFLYGKFGYIYCTWHWIDIVYIFLQVRNVYIQVLKCQCNIVEIWFRSTIWNCLVNANTRIYLIIDSLHNSEYRWVWVAISLIYLFNISLINSSGVDCIEFQPIVWHSWATVTFSICCVYSDILATFWRKQITN